MAIVAPRHFYAVSGNFMSGLLAVVLLGMVAIAHDRESWWYWNRPYVGAAFFWACSRPGVRIAICRLAEFK